jgi:hypothetical protein
MDEPNDDMPKSMFWRPNQHDPIEIKFIPADNAITFSHHTDHGIKKGCCICGKVYCDHLQNKHLEKISSDWINNFFSAIEGKKGSVKW